MNPKIRTAVRSLRPYVPGEQPEAFRLKLNTNENPYPPSPAVAAALRAFPAEQLRLYPDSQCGRLRDRLAERHGCDPAQVLVGNGADEILALCLRAFTEPGGRAGHFDPSYSLYPVLAAIEERRTVPVPLGPGFGWVRPDPGDSDLFFLTCPNAPTGIRYPRDAVEEFCRAHPGVVVIDEAYADFARDRYLDLALRLPNTLAACTLSKAGSLAGLRLGYAIGPAELIEAMNRIRDSYNVDRLAQELAIAALSDPGHMRENARRIAATRDAAARELAALGWETAPSEANFLWTRPGSGPGARERFERLRARGIHVRHFPGPRTGDWLRITVGTDDQMRLLFEELRETARPAP